MDSWIEQILCRSEWRLPELDEVGRCDRTDVVEFVVQTGRIVFPPKAVGIIYQKLHFTIGERSTQDPRSCN